VPALKPSKARVDAGHVEALSWPDPDWPAVAAVVRPAIEAVQIS
jgi:hypothetical protein